MQINLQNNVPLIDNTKEYIQRKFMLQVNRKLLDYVLSKASTATKVILSGRACKGASYWLTTPPNAFYNTIISPPEFRLLLKYSVGIPLMAAPKACPECSKMMDVFGHHALSCRQKSGGIHRHNSIVLSICRQKSGGIHRHNSIVL